MLDVQKWVIHHCVCGSVCAGGHCWMGHNKTALRMPEMFIRVMGPGFVRVKMVCLIDVAMWV